MVTIKEAAVETIKRLPERCTTEDIMYEINFVSQVLDGFKDAEKGKLLTIEELLKRVEEWAR